MKDIAVVVILASIWMDRGVFARNLLACAFEYVFLEWMRYKGEAERIVEECRLARERNKKCEDGIEKG